MQTIFWRKLHMVAVIIVSMYECVFRPNADGGSGASRSGVGHVMYVLLYVLLFPGRAWISGTQRRRWSRGTKGSLRSPRRCWSSWPIWWEGKLLLPVWIGRPKHWYSTDTLSFFFYTEWQNLLFCIISHVWSRMIAQQGSTRKTVFPIVLSWTATDFSLPLLLNKRGASIQFLIFFIVKLSV